jgi:hypoxanthine phosphoribosyltransferase
MREDMDHILFTEEDLRACVRRVAGEIARDYAGKEPIVVGILRGSFVFLADLARELGKLGLPIRLEFLSVSSYGGGTESSGVVTLKLDISENITGRDVILVEDMLDTGNTLSYLIPYLRKRKPASVKLCVLLDKPARRLKDVETHYLGFTVPDEFVVGYGLDFNQRYRNLPYIGVLKPELYGE